ncbi:cyclic nucleotide-binding domain-containing protein [Chelatococcus sp. SYSU_G07232]|uniref:Cyclic nucleotide-binding domain-containing protein n=1 Tax=Chelatococcus albus TaxID=3047466 RepID=A0ABT7AH49_9HYPH|nr:cyclic nucleotide-binding domain-containing protein [Chelatococcus sp. SYSU_G07232]MDJ1158700.1 cyclic nucleotide-binding domain-containing protein [Chelatococcus sp. SYSU_G07232]
MSLNDDIALLAGVPTLAIFDREALRLIAFAAETRNLRAGDVLFRRGEPANAGFVVVRGSIALDARDDGSPAGYVAGPGTLIGELALIVRTDRPATAIAREPSTVMKLTRNVVHRVLGEFPEAAVALRRVMAERLSTMTHDLARVRGALMAIDERR